VEAAIFDDSEPGDAVDHAMVGYGLEDAERDKVEALEALNAALGVRINHIKAGLLSNADALGADVVAAMLAEAQAAGEAAVAAADAKAAEQAAAAEHAAALAPLHRAVHDATALLAKLQAERDAAALAALHRAFADAQALLRKCRAMEARGEL
jgi:chemosensory pili system protein ChpA (sensor histidine kinase/response regulator)